ncbi:MAG: polyprenyl synthetase family protein [Patescibacteria group bacterium]
MEQINFQNELDNVKKPVWSVIDSYLPKSNSDHHKMIRDYPERQGKYFRPALVLWSAKMFGEKSSKALLTAAAMQLSEDWLLTHDDFLDHSLERRHLPSLNALHGDELAVNAGDALHLVMWKVIGNNAKILKNSGWKIYEKFYEILATTLEGQFLEVSWIKNKKINITENEYYNLIDIKAGLYTVVGPIELGALVAGAGKEIKKIKSWGIPFGRAFQIWDDVMNVSVSADIQGKENGGDILEGKRTILLIHLLRNCAKKEKDAINAIYLKKREEKSEQEKNYIISLMEKYGSIGYAKKKAEYFSRRAGMDFDKEYSRLPRSKEKEMIRESINFVINRKK